MGQRLLGLAEQFQSLQSLDLSDQGKQHLGHRFGVEHNWVEEDEAPLFQTYFEKI